MFYLELTNDCSQYHRIVSLSFALLFFSISSNNNLLYYDYAMKTGFKLPKYLIPSLLYDKCLPNIPRETSRILSFTCVIIFLHTAFSCHGKEHIIILVPDETKITIIDEDKSPLAKFCQ